MPERMLKPDKGFGSGASDAWLHTVANSFPISCEVELSCQDIYHSDDILLRAIATSFPLACLKYSRLQADRSLVWMKTTEQPIVVDLQHFCKINHGRESTAQAPLNPVLQHHRCDLSRVTVDLLQVRRIR